MNTNLSAEENFRIHGAVPAEQLVELLDGVDLIDKVDTAQIHMREASASFAKEDFLQEEVAELRVWLKSKRGQNKADFESLIERIEQALADQRGEAEYGADELKQALKALD